VELTGATPASVISIPQFPLTPDGKIREAWKTANDSAFPYLLNSTGNTHIAFFGNGINYRATGNNLTTMGPAVSPTNAVLSGWAGQFDQNGAWLFAAQRVNGVIYGFYHAEDHQFADGGYGEWNSTGLATSTDDGASWTRRGQIIGLPKPAIHDTAGREANGVIYDTHDPDHPRWLAIGHGKGFVSTDPGAAPGTWKAWDGDNFGIWAKQPAPDGVLPPLPGLSDDMATNSITWNTYLNRFVMVWQKWGDSNVVRITTSADGVSWDPSKTLTVEPTSEDCGKAAPCPVDIRYPQINGVSSTQSGQTPNLVYEKWPATRPDRERDMKQVQITFTRTSAP
jgi:hypothetical protein